MFEVKWSLRLQFYVLQSSSIDRYLSTLKRILSYWSTNLLLTKTLKSQKTIEQIWEITKTSQCVELSLMISWIKTTLNFDKSIRRSINSLIVLFSRSNFTRWNLSFVVQSRLLISVIWQYIQNIQCLNSMISKLTSKRKSFHWFRDDELRLMTFDYAISSNLDQ